MPAEVDQFPERLVTNFTFERSIVFVRTDVRLEIARRFTLPPADGTQTSEANARGLVFPMLSFARVRTAAVFAFKGGVDFVPGSLVFFELPRGTEPPIASTAREHGFYAFVLMRRFHMLSHLFYLLEELSTEYTLQRRLGAVGVMVSRHVPLERRLLLEAGTAGFAFERSVFNVDYLVRIEVPHLGETFAAIAALEWLLSRMRENVRPEIESSVEHLRAVLAFKPSVVIVYSYVSPKIAADCEGTITHLTLEGAFTGVRSHVDFKIRAIREGFHA